MLLGLFSWARNVAVADSLPNLTCERVEEGLDGGAGLLHAKGGIAARGHPVTRTEDVLAECDVLTRDIGLVLPAAIVEADHTAVCRRALRPVDPPVAPECQLFGRVVAGRQIGDERGHCTGHRVHGDDSRTVVLPIVLMRRLVGIGREKRPPGEAVDEGDVDCRP